MIMVLGPTKKKTEVRTERAADKARRDESAPVEAESPAETAESTDAVETEAVEAPAAQQTVA
jgi:hypothetical protein